LKEDRRAAKLLKPHLRKVNGEQSHFHIFLLFPTSHAIAPDVIKRAAVIAQQRVPLSDLIALVCLKTAPHYKQLQRPLLIKMSHFAPAALLLIVARKRKRTLGAINRARRN
jgi:hypothetical protein